MMKKLLRLFLILAALASAAVGSLFQEKPALADEEDMVYKHSKQEEVLHQLQSREIRPYEEILEIVRPKIHGEIIETEFEIEDGIPVYEFKYIDTKGRVLEMYVDAKTGKILKEEFD